MRLRRLLWLIPVFGLVAVGYSLWLALQVKGDLEAARNAGTALQDAVRVDDRQARDAALEELRSAAAAADEHTSGRWWGLVTHAPLVGDDASGARALSQSLDLLAADGAPPMLRTMDLLDGLTSQGQVDLAVLRKISPSVGSASTAFEKAADLVGDLDSSGYAGPVRTQFDDYVELVTDADRTLRSATTAVDVLPGILGQDEPRNYLLVFQNNAEIRATGGMPGSWAQLRADQGRLEMVQQGTAGDFPVKDRPVLPLTPGERAVYDDPLGIYFQDIGFAPDFPRAAELANAHWRVRFPGIPLDGVIALDPVAMSYLLDGTGPIDVMGRSLTSENAVAELLSRPYLELDTTQQDAFFAAAARGIFDAATGDLADPLAFVRGLSRATEEGRFLVASFDEEERDSLRSTGVERALTGDDGETPHVDIGLNDATGSKMSYYLRYQAEMRATACTDGQQTLMASMSLSQAIASSDAAKLPDSVTGGGNYGTDPGDQLVLVRVYAPYGGTIGKVRMDGRALPGDVSEIDGRQVETLVVQLSNTKDVVINWTMETGPGQTADTELTMTPSVVPGSKDDVVPSAC